MSRTSPENINVFCKDTYNSRTDPAGRSTTYSMTKRARSWISTNTPSYAESRYNHTRVPNNHYELDWNEINSLGDLNIYRETHNSVSDWDRIVTASAAGVYAGPPPGNPSNWKWFNELSHDFSLDRRAVDGAMERIRGQSVNLAQAAAERQQTVRLIEDTVKRLTKCIVSIKKGRPGDALAALGLSRNAKRFSGSVADQWLAMQYGWKPLLSDVKGAAEALAESNLNHPIFIEAKVVKKKTEPAFSLSTFDMDFGYFDWNIGETLDLAKCKLSFVVENDFIRQGNKLGITDPLTLAWELLPWSFVVDWFLPVGDFISKLNYTNGLSFKGGTVSRFTTRSQSVGPRVGRSTWQRYGAPATLTVSGSPDRSRLIKHYREVLQSPPSPMLPQLKDPFSTTHVMNALALMRGQFRVR